MNQVTPKGKYKYSHAQNFNQLSLFNSSKKHQFCHGGILRNKTKGRGLRPLSTREPLHVVFKAHQRALRHSSFRSSQGHKLICTIIKKYSKKFFIKIEQQSVQGDHLHLLIRATKRSMFHHFFRVVAGQIAQQFEKNGLLKFQSQTDTSINFSSKLKLWQFRPFSRVVRSCRALLIIRDYIKLNEQEALGSIKYSQHRLRGLSMKDWEFLW